MTRDHRLHDNHTDYHVVGVPWQFVAAAVVVLLLVAVIVTKSCTPDPEPVPATAEEAPRD